MTDEVEEGWLIYKAGRGWYRPNAQGYTNDPAEAGRYSLGEALSYSHPNGWDGPRDGITIKHESKVEGAKPEPASDMVERVARAILASRIGRNSAGYSHLPRSFDTPFDGDYVDAAAAIRSLIDREEPNDD